MQTSSWILGWRNILDQIMKLAFSCLICFSSALWYCNKSNYITSHVVKAVHARNKSCWSSTSTQERRFGGMRAEFIRDSCTFYKNGVQKALSEMRKKDGRHKEDKAEKLCPVKLSCWAESIRLGGPLGTIPFNPLVFDTRKQRHAGIAPCLNAQGWWDAARRSARVSAEVWALHPLLYPASEHPQQLPLQAELTFLPAGKPRYFLYGTRSALEPKCNKQQRWALNLGLWSSKVRDLQPLPCITLTGQQPGATAKPLLGTSDHKLSSLGALTCTRHCGDGESIWVPARRGFLDLHIPGTGTGTKQGLASLTWVPRDLAGVPRGQGASV